MNVVVSSPLSESGNEAHLHWPQDGDHSGTWDDWSEEPGSARSQAREPRPEPYQWKLPLWRLNWVMSIMYTEVCRVLHMMGAHGAVDYLQARLPLLLMLRPFPLSLLLLLCAAPIHIAGQ